MPCSESAATSDCAVEIDAEANADRKHFGQDEGAESADEDAAGDGEVNAGAWQVSAAGELASAPRRDKCRERHAGEDDEAEDAKTANIFFGEWVAVSNGHEQLSKQPQGGDDQDAGHEVTGGDPADLTRTRIAYTDDDVEVVRRQRAAGEPGDLRSRYLSMDTDLVAVRPEADERTDQQKDPEAGGDDQHQRC